MVLVSLWLLLAWTCVLNPGQRCGGRSGPEVGQAAGSRSAERTLGFCRVLAFLGLRKGLVRDPGRVVDVVDEESGKTVGASVKPVPDRRAHGSCLARSPWSPRWCAKGPVAQAWRVVYLRRSGGSAPLNDWKSRVKDRLASSNRLGAINGIRELLGGENVRDPALLRAKPWCGGRTRAKLPKTH